MAVLIQTLTDVGMIILLSVVLTVVVIMRGDTHK